MFVLIVLMENSNLIEKFLFSLLVSPIFIGVIMIIKTNVSLMWIRCLITINVGCEFCNRGSICTVYIYICARYWESWLIWPPSSIYKTIIVQIKKNKYGQYVSWRNLKKKNHFHFLKTTISQEGV